MTRRLTLAERAGRGLSRRACASRHEAVEAAARAVSGVPATAAPTGAFRVRSHVIARRARVKRLVVRAAIVQGGESRQIAAKVLRRLRVGKPRAFSLRVVIPTRRIAAGPARIRVCARSRCRTRSLTITTSPAVAPSPTATPTGTASPTATPSPVPDASPTPTCDGDDRQRDRGGHPLPGPGQRRLRRPALRARPVLHTGHRPTQRLGDHLATATQDLSRFSLDWWTTSPSARSRSTGSPPPSPTRTGQAARHPTRRHHLRRGLPPSSPTAGRRPRSPTQTAPTRASSGPGRRRGRLRAAGREGWFPNNNHPSDKAALRLKMTVPMGVEVIGNGLLTDETTQRTDQLLHLGRDAPDGDLPRHRHARATSRSPRARRRTASLLRRDRSRPAGRCRTQGRSLARARRSLPVRHLRRVPVRERRFRSSTTSPRAVIRWRPRPSRSTRRADRG